MFCWLIDNLISLITFFTGTRFWIQNKLYTAHRSCKSWCWYPLSKFGSIQWHNNCKDNCGRCRWTSRVFFIFVSHGGVRSHTGWKYHWNCSSSWPRFFQQPCEVKVCCSPFLLFLLIFLCLHSYFYKMVFFWSITNKLSVKSNKMKLSTE